MRVLLTGAQGFIGRATAAAMLERGHTVLGMGRSPRDDAHMTHSVGWGSRTTASPTRQRHLDRLSTSAYSYQRCDLLDTPALTAAFRLFEPDVVLHLAAALRDESPDRLVASNISTVVSLVEATSGSGVRPPRLVFGSSGSVYGPVDQGCLPITEEQACAPGDPYSVSKRAAEDLGRILATDKGIDAIWARIFNPMGAGQDERHLCGAFGRAIAEIAAGQRPATMHVGPLDTTRDYQHVDDTAAALALLAERGAPGATYNVASGTEVTGAAILAELQQLAGVDEVELTSRPARRMDMKRHFADISAIEALGYAPRHTLSEGLGEILDHYSGAVAREVGARPTAPATASAPPLTVTSQQFHSYEVSTAPGLLDEMPGILTARYPNKPLFVFTDHMVADLYGHRLLSGLRAAGATAELVAVEPGEASKSQSTADRVIAELRDRGFDRRSLLVNLGGGMVSDLGGYVAATYLRGVSYVNVPTTLLAQHDAAIGGKVAVNSQWAKNFVGAFHHPCGVYNDPETLLTLPERELAAGVAESIKVAICGAPGLFDWLRHNPPSALRGNTELLAELVDRSARHKAALLDPDPYEVDLRRVLNLGHTFGHPLETHMAPTGMLHGEAVAFGMAVATGIGIGEGLLGHHEADQILELLALHGLPPGVHRDDLVAASKGFDDVRLVRAGALNFVVPTSTSTTEILPDLDRDALPRAIDWLAGNPISAGWILG